MQGDMEALRDNHNVYEEHKKQKKAKNLPDLQMGYYDKKSQHMGHQSDSDGQNSEQLPMISKGGSGMQQHPGNAQVSQVSEAYSQKALQAMGNTKKSGVNNSKFRSLSPYRTFFKENKKEGQSLIGKKVLPGYGKKANKIYVSNRANC